MFCSLDYRIGSLKCKFPFFLRTNEKEVSITGCGNDEQRGEWKPISQGLLEYCNQPAFPYISYDKLTHTATYYRARLLQEHRISRKKSFRKSRASLDPSMTQRNGVFPRDEGNPVLLTNESPQRGLFFAWPILS